MGGYLSQPWHTAVFCRAVRIQPFRDSVSNDGLLQLLQVCNYLLSPLRQSIYRRSLRVEIGSDAILFCV